MKKNCITVNKDNLDTWQWYTEVLFSFQNLVIYNNRGLSFGTIMLMVIDFIVMILHIL